MLFTPLHIAEILLLLCRGEAWPALAQGLAWGMFVSSYA